MGLKSLPILNKSGISMYWYNIWDSIKLYKRYNYSYIFLKELIYNIFSENMYYYCIFKKSNWDEKFKTIKKIPKSYETKIKYGYRMRNLYIGNIVFYSFQNWSVISINYFLTRRFKIRFKKRVFKNFKQIFKKFYIIKLNFDVGLNNYKYKF